MRPNAMLCLLPTRKVQAPGFELPGIPSPPTNTFLSLPSYEGLQAYYKVADWYPPLLSVSQSVTVSPSGAPASAYTHTGIHPRTNTGSASRKDWPLLCTHPEGEETDQAQMIFTLRPLRRHDILCDGGAIGNAGNKCETVTPHSHPPYLYVPCAFKVARSRSPSQSPQHKFAAFFGN